MTAATAPPPSILNASQALDAAEDPALALKAAAITYPGDESSADKLTAFVKGAGVKALPVLLHALEHGGTAVRETAFGLLRDMDLGPESRATLATSFERDKPRIVRTAALRAIGRLEGALSLPLAKHAFDDPDVRREAAEILLAHGDEAARRDVLETVGGWLACGDPIEIEAARDILVYSIAPKHPEIAEALLLGLWRHGETVEDRALAGRGLLYVKTAAALEALGEALDEPFYAPLPRGKPGTRECLEHAIAATFLRAPDAAFDRLSPYLSGAGKGKPFSFGERRARGIVEFALYLGGRWESALAGRYPELKARGTAVDPRWNDVVRAWMRGLQLG